MAMFRSDWPVRVNPKSLFGFPFEMLMVICCDLIDRTVRGDKAAGSCLAYQNHWAFITDCN